MEGPLQAVALKVFIALGGVVAILGILRKGTGPAVRAAVHWMVGENHPLLRGLLLDHRAWVEGVFDDADQALKEQLNIEASAAPASASAAPAPRMERVGFFRS